MLRRIIYIISVFFIGNTSLCSQSAVSYYMGVTNNTKIVKFSSSSNTKVHSQNGIQAAVTYERKILRWLVLKSGLEIVQKNTQIKRDGFYEGIYLNSRSAYGQIPLIASLDFQNGNLTGFCDLGIYNAYWLSGRFKGVLPNILSPLDYQEEDNENELLKDFIKTDKIDQLYEFNSDRDSRYEFGYIGGVGVKYRILKQLEIVLQGRYYYAATSKVKNSTHFNQKEFNETSSLTIGAVYHLNKKEKK